MGRLTGKVAFITGAARGQGRSHAVRLASEGADIIATDICAPLDVQYESATPEDLAETVSLVEAEGRKVLALKADVRNSDELQAAVNSGVETFGHLDIVVANAGIQTSGRLWELSEDRWSNMININLSGVWRTLKATIPTLIEQGSGGSIICISSVAGLRGVPFLAHYVAAKHGVTGLARAASNELGIYDIRVNSIHPAGVRTEMNNDPVIFNLIKQFPDTLAPIFMNSLPYDMLEVEDVSHVVAWLASDEARYVTGVQIPVDFGTLSR